MIRAAALALLLLAPAARADVAAEAARAAADLQTAIAAMQQADRARDRVAALTQTIRAYEQGLEALREGLRQAAIREAALQLQFEAKRDRVARLLGVLAALPAQGGPLLLIHPTGPLGTARSGLMLAEVTPSLQAEAAALRAELTEVQDLRLLQAGAARTLQDGLAAAQAARTALSQAMADRTDLPRRFTDDPEALKALLQAADTLDAFAAGLAPVPGADTIRDFAAAQGELPLPVLGTLLRAPGEADAAGIRRPGVILATRPGALVTAPWPGTIRYLGPLLDYGNVIVLEPGEGYLLVLAGLGTVYGAVGEVVAQAA
ncbi:MAG: peptidase M23, partial [Rhodobacterales bacterium]|nr:peptidase M23 [Rhodobacterales bacterium]